MKLDSLDISPIYDEMFMSEWMSWYVYTEGQEPPENSRRQDGDVTFHTKDSQILGATIQNTTARAIWRPGFVDPR